MRDIDWEIISTLYKTQNITKAASLLYVTQPTLTKHIKNIEKELGVELIIRNQKGICFTPCGIQIVKKAEQILNTINNIKTLVDNDTVATLKIGAPRSYAHFVLPSLIESFSKRYPSIKLEMVVGCSDKLLKDVENHLIPVSFVRGDFITELEKSKISEDQYYIVYNKPFLLDDLPHLHFIDFVKGQATIKATDDWWNEHFDFPHQVKIKVDNSSTCYEMIKKDTGYGIFSDNLSFFHDPSVYTMPMKFLDGRKLLRRTWLVFDKAGLNNLILYNFINFIDHFDFDKLEGKNMSDEIGAIQ